MFLVCNVGKEIYFVDLFGYHIP